MSKGKAFLLKIKNGDSFETVAGLRANQLSVNGSVEVDARKDGWREIVCGAGTRSLSALASGIFLGSDAEAQIRARALSGTLDDYELSFEDGQRLRGRFLVQRLDYAGDFNGERTYSLQLESSGEVVAA